jgi:hypothetical protein
MVDKETGHPEHASLQFGGFLSVGSDNYPMPWAVHSMRLPPDLAR